MTKRTMMKLCMALFVLAVALGMVGLSPAQNAQAAACCSECNQLYQDCVDGFAYPSCGGNPTCCNTAVRSCLRSCDFDC